MQTLQFALPRIPTSIFFAGLATVALFLLMQHLISNPADVTDARPTSGVVDFVRVAEDTHGLPAMHHRKPMLYAANVELSVATIGNFQANHRLPSESLDRERYTHFDTNPVHLVSEDPVSTFSIDVDTASYSNIRRLLNQGALPRHDAVRVEEMINYFSYGYPVSGAVDRPFAVYTEVGPSPWHPKRHLMHIGIKGHELPASESPPSNLVFLIDVSGSMRTPDKLDLVKASMRLMIGEIASTSDSYRFSAAVAGFGQLLRGGEYVGTLDFRAVEQLAVNARGEDLSGYRGEFLSLLRTARVLEAGAGGGTHTAVSIDREDLLVVDYEDTRWPPRPTFRMEKQL